MTEIRKLEQQVEAVDYKISSVLSILKGNDINQEDKGMIGMQNDHENRLTSLEKLKDKAVWFLIGMSIPAGWGMVDIISKLLNK